MIDVHDRENASNAAGMVFGHLTLIRPTGELIRGVTVYECRCECGNLDKATIPLLKMGRKTSCGCRNRAKLEASKPELPEVERLRALIAADGRTLSEIAATAGLPESAIIDGLASGRKLTLSTIHILLQVLGKSWSEFDDPGARPSLAAPSRISEIPDRTEPEQAEPRCSLPQDEWAIPPNGVRPRHLTSLLSRNRFQPPAWFQADRTWMAPFADGDGLVFGGESI